MPPSAGRSTERPATLAREALLMNDPLYRVTVTDQVCTLVEFGGLDYESPPQPREQALDLVRLLLGGELPDEHGPWARARAGGRRTVRLEVQR
jgi:hypothetical protein